MVDGISQMHITDERDQGGDRGRDHGRAAGGAKVHSQTSGVAHIVAKNEQECFDKAKKLLSFLPSSYQAAPPVVACTISEPRDGGDRDIIPENPSGPTT